ECLTLALHIVGYQRDRRATPVLAGLLLDRPVTPFADEDIAILHAIAAIADPKAAPALRTYCTRQTAKLPHRDDKPFENYWTIQGVGSNVALAEALGVVADPAGVWPLILMNTVAYDGHGGEVVKQAAIRALAKVGPPAVPELTRALELFEGKYGPQ